MSTEASITYFPEHEPTVAELAALKWLTGYRHGTVDKRALIDYYEHCGVKPGAAAGGRMWRRLCGKRFVDHEAGALTAAGIKAARS